MENYLDNAVSAEEIPVLALAYIGDSVYELYIRSRVLSSGMRKINDLHKHVITYVCASAQSRAIHLMEQSLTEEEIAVFKRGRNAKSSPPKNADMTEYKNATGFEALLGYLYIKKQDKRLNELLLLAFSLLDQNNT